MSVTWSKANLASPWKIFKLGLVVCLCVCIALKVKHMQNAKAVGRKYTRANHGKRKCMKIEWGQLGKFSAIIPRAFWFRAVTNKLMCTRLATSVTRYSLSVASWPLFARSGHTAPPSPLATSLSFWITAHVIGASAHFKIILNGFFLEINNFIWQRCGGVFECVRPCVWAFVRACVRGIYHNFIIWAFYVRRLLNCQWKLKLKFNFVSKVKMV